MKPRFSRTLLRVFHLGFNSLPLPRAALVLTALKYISLQLFLEPVSPPKHQVHLETLGWLNLCSLCWTRVKVFHCLGVGRTIPWAFLLPPPLPLLGTVLASAPGPGCCLPSIYSYQLFCLHLSSVGLEGSCCSLPALLLPFFF